MQRSSTVAGILTVEDPGGAIHRLSAADGVVRLDLASLRSVPHVLGLMRRVKPAQISWKEMVRILPATGLAIQICLKGREFAVVKPGEKGGFLARWLGIPGLRLRPGRRVQEIP